jgi:predicted RNA-binding protein with PUA-like domain
MTRYWLMKTEPGVVGIDDVLAMPKQTVDWWGVRNYQARNFMRDQMQVGDGVLLLPLQLPEPGIAGIGRSRLDRLPRPHPVRPQKPLLRPQVDAGGTTLGQRRRPRRQEDPIGRLDELRAHAELANMRVLQRGNRLSITPVDPAEWKFITGKLIGKVNK